MVVIGLNGSKMTAYLSMRDYGYDSPKLSSSSIATLNLET